MSDIKLYKVGGWVRDKLLGVQSKDLDYAVEAPSYEAMRAYVAERGTIFFEKPEYLTIRGKINGEDVDFVLCRKDGDYSDGRRPDSVQPGTIYDDLARRDFTMNAIALGENGIYIDPYNGRLDIEDRVISCVGKAEDRFNEDALRILRAFRFSVTKNFNMDWKTESLIREEAMINMLSSVSEERIREELQKCFSFDTLDTIGKLNKFPVLRDWIFTNTNLWLEVTAKKKK